MKALLAAIPLALGGALALGTQEPKPDEGLRPVSYFNDKCARCHGEAGSRYGDLSARTDEQLKKSIQEMAAGPGDAPLTDRGLALQLALHRAIRAQEPFVAVVSSREGKVEGETFPSATVVLLSKGKATKLENKEGRFLLETKDPKATVAARMGKKVATVIVRRLGTSHDAPVKIAPGTSGGGSR